MSNVLSLRMKIKRVHINCSWIQTGMSKHLTKDILVTKYHRKTSSCIHVEECLESNTKCGITHSVPQQQTLATVGWPIFFQICAWEAKASHRTMENWMPLWTFVTGKDTRFEYEKWFQDNTLSGFTFSNSSRTLLEAKTSSPHGFYLHALK